MWYTKLKKQKNQHVNRVEVNAENLKQVSLPLQYWSKWNVNLKDFMENKNNLNPIISYLTLVENVYGLFSPLQWKVHTLLSPKTQLQFLS